MLEMCLLFSHYIYFCVDFRTQYLVIMSPENSSATNLGGGHIPAGACGQEPGVGDAWVRRLVAGGGG